MFNNAGRGAEESEDPSACRRAGFTPRGMIDCMIASVAWRNSATVLTADRDLIRVATVIGVDLDVGVS